MTAASATLPAPPGPGVCASSPGGTSSLGSLFSGLGNFERGLAAGGFQTAWQVESDPFRRRVLAERFDAEQLEDVREASGLPKADALCGGFPCQDLSGAGAGAGIEGDRSGLWAEFARLIGEQEPRLVFIENVPPLLRRGFDVLLRDLIGLGFAVEWDCIPAAAIGAPHLRDRLWVVAHRGSEPSVFAPPDRYYFHRPGGQRGSPWLRWPRAGFAIDRPDECLGLAPLATVRASRGGALLPTPASVHYGSSQNGINGKGGENERPSAGSPSLETMAKTGLWPTPKAEVSGPDYAREGRERSGGDDLATAAARLEPGQLNPDWVEWLMGMPCGWSDPERELEQLLPSDWREEPCARTAEGVKDRGKRLSACGDSLVAQVPAWLCSRLPTEALGG